VLNAGIYKAIGKKGVRPPPARRALQPRSHAPGCWTARRLLVVAALSRRRAAARAQVYYGFKLGHTVPWVRPSARGAAATAVRLAQAAPRRCANAPPLPRTARIARSRARPGARCRCGTLRRAQFSGFPFNLGIRHPQYVGSVLTIWGLAALLWAPDVRPALPQLAGGWTLMYVVTGLVEDKL
jgi:hypothetical protein